MKKQFPAFVCTRQAKKRRQLFILVVFLITHFTLFSQDWTNPMVGENPNFYEIQKSFDAYWRGKDFKTTKGWKPYRRWENFWRPRINPDGSFPAPDKIATELENYRIINPSFRQPNPFAPEDISTTTGTWTTMGPTTSSSGYSGIGRINSVAFHPTDVNTFWVGTPAGGLWKTSNGGTNWSTNSDAFPSLGVSAIAVHPTNPDIIYIGTGDGDGYDTYFYGILKSIDGGATWATLPFPSTTPSVSRRIIINPTTPSTVIASTSNGVYRTTNDGTTWVRTSISTNMYDIAFKPGDPNIVYASSGSQIFVSGDGGATWTASTIGTAPANTIANSRRIALAVSPADPNVVGVLSAQSAGSGFNGYYESTNSGASFTLKTNAPNLLGWNTDGGDVGGQGGYDLCLAISPTNINTIYVGGVNTWKSTNGGTTWAINTHWWQSSFGFTAVHADKHFLAYQNSGALFQCNDGGIYKTTNDGTSWTDISNGLVISQMYKLGTAQTSAAVMTGLQDNSSKLMTPSVSWLDILSTGDGMEGAIDPLNDKIAYTESYYGDITRLGLNASYQRSSSVDITPLTSSNVPEEGAWVTPFVLDPNNPATIYIGYKDIYKSLNRGSAWAKISTGLSPNNLLNIAVAPSNSNYIYASNGSSTLYKTTDGGATPWVTITTPSTIGSLSYITVSLTDPNILYVTGSNSTAGQKIFKSIDGGTTWTNISGTLPNVPANCVIYEKNTNEGLYIGTDLGVFYKNALLPDWIPFQNGLPNVIVNELEINYSTSKVIAATYGRGLWQSDLYSNGPPACNVPTTLTSSNITALSARLSWAGAQLATGYTVLYRPVTTPAASWTNQIASAINTTISGLTPATQYEWQVQSNCGVGNSAFSTISTFTTAAGGCTRVPTTNSFSTNTYLATVNVVWNSQTSILNYKVEMKKTSDATWSTAYTVPTTPTNYTINGLLGGTAYQWRVSSTCTNEVVSAPSTVATFTTPLANCSAPVLSILNTWSNAVRLSWSAVFGKGYVLAYRKVGETTWLYRTFSNNTSLHLDNLLPSTAYEAKIKVACDGVGETYSNLLLFTTGADACAGKLVPMTDLSATNITTTTATLNWSPIPTATGYRVEVTGLSGFTPQNVTGTSYNLTGLTSGASYSFKVSPLCASGTPITATASYSFKASNATCKAPQIFNTLASTTPTTGKIYWGGVGGAASYSVQIRKADPVNYANSINPWTTFTTSNTNFEFTGLSATNTYDYLVLTTANTCSLPNSTISTPELIVPLPIELLNFTAHPLSKTVQLNWQTAFEKDASYFDIERSSDGKTFAYIGKIKAVGESVILQNYAFMDEKPVNGVNYYRLRQVDVDGKETLSKTVSASIQSKTQLKTYPNPVSTVLMIETENTGDFEIVNLLGQVLMKGKVANRIDVSVLSQGTYILKVGEEQARFVKQ